MSHVTPIKNTVGEGFTVEEKVVSALACHLLAGVPWTSGTGGQIQFIDCQTRQDGWFFDDTVVRLKKDGVDLNCGCSIKSYGVFGQEGALIGFLRSLWQQWETVSDTGFKRGRDCLAVIATQHPTEIRKTWIGLTEEARVIATDVFASRFDRDAVPSIARASAFASLQRSHENGGNPHSATEVAELLRSLYLVEHDFDNSSSGSVGSSIALCQLALADSERARAEELWEAVVVHCAKIRRKGGRIELPALMGALAQKFKLKNHPNYASDWASLTSAGSERIASLPSKLAGVVSIERKEILNLLAKETEAAKPVPVLGESGNGKSVVASHWARQAGTNSIWLTPADLSAPGGLRAVFKLGNSLADIFSGSGSQGRLVIDGMDKCFDDAAFNEAALVLRAATAPECRERWRIVLTCCPEDWSRVLAQLIRREVEVSGNAVRVGRFGDADLRVVADQLSDIGPVLRRPHLSPILRWPKALDIVATNWRTGGASQQWVSESALARWFWDSAIRRGNAALVRERITRNLAVRLGDKMVSGVSLDDFRSDEIQTLNDLAAEGHLEIERKRQVVRFSHDLIADWARQCEIQAQGSSAGAFLRQRLTLPLWHRAVRFHGLDLLESDSDTKAWESLFQAFASGTPGDEIGQNLLLESPVFAIGQHDALKRLWPILTRDKGSLLRRFLRQFLQVATVPDEQKVAQVTASNPDFALQAATILRLPWVPYWLGLLQVLSEHVDEVVNLAADEVADICLMWLPLRHFFTAGMDIASKISVAAARAFENGEARMRSSYRDDSTEEKICRALFAASYDLPIEVTDLCLKLCGRRESEASEPPFGKRTVPLPISYFDRGEAKPWPDGPTFRCSPTFRKVFMNRAYSAPFLTALPKIAAEVMFAVLLDIPREREDPRHFSHDLDEHGFDHDFHPPSCFWTNGPFLTFLHANPEAALPAIIRLINFASDRAWELPESLREHLAIDVTIDGEKCAWKGHQHSFLWYKGHVFGPRAVCCALMSLEKWLYMLIDENRELESHLAKILSESRSIALASVLICVGKRKPELFLGPLRPLIEAPEFLRMDALEIAKNGGAFRDTVSTESLKSVIALMTEWAEMPHRKKPLGDTVLALSFQEASWRAVVDDLRTKWQARLETLKADPPPWLAAMVVRYNADNWRVRRTDGGSYEFIFVAPDQLPQASKQETESLERTGYLIFLPLSCEQMLNGKKECTTQQIEEWWSKLAEIRMLDIPDADAEFMNSANALCAIAAVAVVLHRPWVAAEPSRLNEILKILKDTASKPPRSRWFFENESTDYKWDNFLAWAGTTLWCENPSDPFLSELVGNLVLWKRYLVVERVMLVAGASREALGEQFERLLAFAIRYSASRDRFRCKAEAPSPDEDDSEFQAWHIEAIQRFCSGKVDPLPKSWESLAEPVKIKGFPKDTLSVGLDIHQIYSSLSWATDLEKARNPEERRKWIEYHRQTLACALIRIKIESKEKGDNTPDRYERNSPYKEEENVLERVAILVANLNLGEEHRQLWEPIFFLGCSAAGWIEKFTFNWLLESAGHSKPALVEQWRVMLGYAENSTAWKAQSRRGRESNRMWDYLLGFSPFTHGFWRSDLAPALEAVREYHERWAASHVSNSHSAEKYIYFLLTQAGRPLRVNGLVILNSVAPTDGSGAWRYSTALEAVATFLERLLSEQWEEVVANPAAKAAFMAFCTKLVSLQNPLGSELLSTASARLLKI